MPIHQANLNLYPENWREFAFALKDSQGWVCQDCGLRCRKMGESWQDFCDRTGVDVAQGWGRYTCNVAHLDQNPQNSAPENLRVLCVVCHLQRDRPFHVSNSFRIRERLGQLNLFKPELLFEACPIRRDRVQLPIPANPSARCW
jgi:hypothetical protein